MRVLTENTAKLWKILEKVQDLPEIPPGVAQATPSISVSSGGLITASATQEAGVVEAGTKSATRQLPTKGGTTITPGDAEQTAVEAGTFVTGDIKVAAQAAGSQVAMGSVTVSGKTISIAPGFQPTRVLLATAAAVKSTSGTYVQVDANDIVYQNGVATLRSPGYDSVSSTKLTVSYNNGTMTFTNTSSFTSGTWRWMAAS